MSTLTKDELRRPDGFLAALRSFFKEISSHLGLSVGIGIAIVVIGALYSWWSAKTETRVDQGRAALYQAERAYAQAMTTLQNAAASAAAAKKPAKTGKDAKADAADAPDVLPEVSVTQLSEAQVSTIVTAYEAVAQKHASERSGYEAMLALGDLLADRGQTERAIEWYTKATSASKAGMDRALAWMALGMAQENASKWEPALTSYETALKQGEAGLKADLLLAKARVLEVSGKKTEAIAVYDQLIKDVPNSPQSRQAELLKAQLSS